MKSNHILAKALVAAGLGLAAAGAQAVAMVGLTTDNRIVNFDSATPGNWGSLITITGTTERIIGIDTGSSKPGSLSGGKMWGVGTGGGVYTIDNTTGAATLKFTLAAGTINSALTYGIDFNVFNDENNAASLRLVSSAGNNMAINVGTNVLAFNMQNLPANFGGVAYNNFTGVAGDANTIPKTGLYYIDHVTDQLFFTTSYNANPNPVLIGALGIDSIGAFGFEAVSQNVAFASLTSAVTGLGGLYSINLATGAAILVGGFPAVSVLLNGLTAAPIPEAETYAMMLAGLVGVGFMVRRRKQQA